MKKTTQILGLGILFLFATTLSLSAQKCKYDFNKTDRITGEQSKGIGFKIEFKMAPGGIGTIYRSSMGFNKVGESYHVNVELMFTGQLRERILKSDPLIIKLSNGETITIYPQADFTPTATAGPTSVFSQYDAKYDIDAASLQKIAESAPVFFRISLQDKVYDRELSKKDQKNFMNAARCILQ